MVLLSFILCFVPVPLGALILYVESTGINFAIGSWQCRIDSLVPMVCPSLECASDSEDPRCFVEWSLEWMKRVVTLDGAGWHDMPDGLDFVLIFGAFFFIIWLFAMFAVRARVLNADTVPQSMTSAVAEYELCEVEKRLGYTRA